MPTLRRLAYTSLVLAFAHIVFGAIVRITGSGMGCGDNWPKCYGYWFPPMSRPDLVIEVTHRYLAAALLAAIVTLFYVAWTTRQELGVSGRGGVLRAAGLGTALWFAPALLGAVTVFLGNTALATAAHKLLAMMLLAVLVSAVVRTGGFGAGAAAAKPASDSTRRGAIAAAALALTVVMLGGLTAKIPGAAVACQGFPLCGASPLPRGGAQHLHMAHRILAFLLALHMISLTAGARRRGEASAITRAAILSVIMIMAQIAVAAAMVLNALPQELRSLHQAIGVSIWIGIFLLAYLSAARSWQQARLRTESVS
ncbi:MAG: heme A synthase [Gemmatimonadaceae bacterium]